MNITQLMARIESRIKLDSKNKNKPNNPEEGRNLNENSTTKSNSLARAYYRFNLIEKRVMESLISQLNPKCEAVSQIQKLELKAIDYSRTFNVSKKHAYEHIENAVGGLMHKVFSISTPKGREEFTLMSNAQYVDGEGKITCSFNPYIVPHLIGLHQKFTKYPLVATINFKSSYTWRMYEVLVSWAKNPKHTDGILAGWFTMEINELRQTLGIPKSYKFNHVKLRVLDLAKIELKQNLGIELEIKYIKTGRKITHVKFSFAEIK